MQDLETDKKTSLSGDTDKDEANVYTIDNNIISQKNSFVNIPDELKQQKQWVVHERKIPFNVKKRREDKNIPAEWATFDEALSVACNYDGLGYRFNNNGIVGVDIDTCINPETGEISDEAFHIVNTLDSYTEISPSGYGVHIFVKADIVLPFHRKVMKPNGIVRVVNDKQKVPELELYNNGRYFTMTGDVFGELKPINERSEQLQEIIDLYNAEKNNHTSHTENNASRPNINLSEWEVLDRMFNCKHGTEYKALYNGNTSKYNSTSEADQALCNILCYFSGGDKTLIDSLFRQSGLMRDKWDEKRGERGTYGEITIQKAVSDVEPMRFTSSGTQHKAEQKNQSGTQTEWDNPVPFDSVDLPKFPIDSLPADIRDYVTAISEATQTPVDMAGVAALAVMSTCIQGKYKIKAKNDWIEPLNLYCVIVANPAERKSAVMAHMTKYIEEYEYAKNQEMMPDINKNRLEKKLLQKEIDKLLESAAKEPSAKNKGMLMTKQDEMTEFVEMKPLRLIADDASPEALTSLLAANNGKIAVISSEGGIFEIMNGRYSGGVNIDMFLKAHDSELIIIDRKGRESEYIKNPHLTILLSVQPQVLNGLVSNEIFRGRGLTARFLYSMPESNIGGRVYDTKTIPDECKARYKNLCFGLLKTPQEEQAKLLYLSDEAKEIFEDFFYELEPKHRDEFESMSDFSGKLHGKALRIAGLLHLAGHNLAETLISKETMLNAIILGYYFLDHAKAAYQLMGTDEVTDQCKYILKQLCKSKPQTVNVRELMKICKRFKAMEETTTPISRLCEHGFLREIQTEYSGNGRPQAQRWEVNPAVYRE